MFASYYAPLSKTQDEKKDEIIIITKDDVNKSSSSKELTLKDVITDINLIPKLSLEVKKALTYCVPGMYVARYGANAARSARMSRPRGGKSLARGKSKASGGKRAARSAFWNSTADEVPAATVSKVFSLNDPEPNIRIPKYFNYPFKVSLETRSIAWLVSSASVDVFKAINFTLSALAGAADFTACFDQYSLHKIECWLTPRATASDNSVTNQGILQSAIDYDDSNTPVSAAEMNSYGTVIQSHGGEAHYRAFTPGVAVAGYSGAFTSFLNERAPWIDIASDTVQHYGLKAGISVTSAPFTYDLLYRIHIEFRSTR